jgi:uncharacterized protein YdeI (YjbR/CyaY-like superfamily)
MSDFRNWLETNHDKSDGIWLKIFKVASKIKTISYEEAVEQALCFGWIDGQKKPFDTHAWLQKFTPRRAKSAWSKINVERAERLIEAGLFKQGGLKVVEDAKADGRWQAAYDSSSSATIPDDLIDELNKRPQAKSFFKTLNKVNIYSIVYRLQSAKSQELREKRMVKILDMLDRGEKFHP